MKKVRKRFIFRTVCLLFALFLIVFTTVFLFYVNKLGFIPANYFWMLCGVLAFIILICELILLKKSRKFLMMFLKTIVLLFSLVLFFCYGYAIKYADRTKNVFNSFVARNEEVLSYYVFTISDNGFTEISDFDGKKVGYFTRLDQKVRDAIKIGIDYIEYNDSELMLKDLEERVIDGVIVSNLIKADIDENNEDDKFKLIHTIAIKNKIEDITKKVSIKNTPFVFLISGSDSREKDINAVARNDVNIIVTINPKTNEILLTSIPRDYYVALHGKTGSKDKLTHASYYGINTHVQTLEDLFEIEINYYVKVNFNTVIKLVDAIGGIDIYSDTSFSADGCRYKLGMNHLNGNCALRFARERHIYSGGDRHRIKNQQDVIIAVFSKMKSGGTLVYDYMDILDALEGEFITNLSMDDITSFIKYELNDISKYYIRSFQVNGSNAMDYTYSYPNQLLYVMKPDMDTVKEAQELIGKVLNGKSVKE